MDGHTGENSMKNDNSILIPDEYIPDYSLLPENEKKRREKWNKKSEDAFQKLNISK